LSTNSLETHYTVQEIAEKWHLSEKTVRGLFRSEQGVIVINREERRFKRGYCTIRVPESVMRRVHARLGNRE
jgi:AraC-like DNA-binding protein